MASYAPKPWVHANQSNHQSNQVFSEFSATKQVLLGTKEGSFLGGLIEKEKVRPNFPDHLKFLLEVPENLAKHAGKCIPTPRKIPHPSNQILRIIWRRGLFRSPKRQRKLFDRCGRVPKVGHSAGVEFGKNVNKLLESLTASMMEIAGSHKSQNDGHVGHC